MKHYFLIGIGGIGMQAVARLLLASGHRVSGSDMTEFESHEQLLREGVEIFIGHKAENLASDIDEVIYSVAVPEDNPELQEAKKRDLPIRRRLEIVGDLMADKYGIAVTGTHGKTTTTTMLTIITQAAGHHPTALIGAEVRSLQSNVVIGDGQEMIVEACEYSRSFLDLKPKMILLTNLEEDHLDYYSGLAEIKEAFKEFINLLPQDGVIIVNGDDANLREVLADTDKRVVWAGLSENNDLQAKDSEFAQGRLYFSVNGESLYLKIPGRHNVANAILAWAAAKELGISDSLIKSALEEKFMGSARRFEVIGTAQGITFVDDYGHHPTEIKATLEAAKQYFEGRRILVVFHPHQYSRTRILLPAFAKSFQDADLVVVAPIYAVRDTEEDRRAVSSEILVDEINKVSSNAKYWGDFEEIEKHLKAELRPNDVVITLGAGKADVFGRELLAYLRGAA